MNNMNSTEKPLPQLLFSAKKGQPEAARADAINALAELSSREENKVQVRSIATLSWRNG